MPIFYCVQRHAQSELSGVEAEEILNLKIPEFRNNYVEDLSIKGPSIATEYIFGP